MVKNTLYFQANGNSAERKPKFSKQSDPCCLCVNWPALLDFLGREGFHSWMVRKLQPVRLDWKHKTIVIDRAVNNYETEKLTLTTTNIIFCLFHSLLYWNLIRKFKEVQPINLHRSNMCIYVQYNVNWD